ncbi:MAG: small basic family protein [Bifidobacteriaceae bacterium]|jgi:small basic protein|nr:small basic family protein [Bifidobacteriaceae bacterium]
MYAIVGLVAGVVLGLFLRVPIPAFLQPYLPIMIMAGLDALFGAFRAYLDKMFNDRVFTISFFSNILVAAFIVFLGDQLGIGAQMSTAIVVVLGIRIFSNLATIRRHIFRE